MHRYGTLDAGFADQQADVFADTTMSVDSAQRATTRSRRHNDKLPGIYHSTSACVDQLI
jgi:hypothetical protein